ncbi:MAG: hypothetical protein WBD55_07305 [Dehalococcoidia bacterium]
MNIPRPSSLVLIATAFTALAVLVGACGAGDNEPVAELATPTMTLAPLPSGTPAGLLPRPTGMPSPASSEPTTKRCPPLPVPECHEAGNRVNVYEGLSMERAIAARVMTRGEERWILDEAALQEALKLLDEEVTLEPYDWSHRDSPSRIAMTVVWPRGEGIPWNSLPSDTLDFVLYPDAELITPGLALQWPLQAGFADAILASARNATPTPRPEGTVEPSERPNGGIYFDHPDGELTWDGPDDRLTSLAKGHCGPPQDLVYLYGIPAFMSAGNDFETDPFFWYGGAVERRDDWRWTGYYHGAWQLWQGDDPWTIYLVHADEERFAFAYQTYGCI